MIVLASIFRDAEEYIPRYAEQIEVLRDRLEGDLHVIAVEGDSIDHTYKALEDLNVELLRAEHGGPKYGSSDVGLRWRQLAAAGNVALCAAARHANTKFDRFIYVESDLIWEPKTMVGLIADLEQVPAVSPMSYIWPWSLAMSQRRRTRFYDVWGYRGLDGEAFEQWVPFHPSIREEGLTEIDSSGSCFALTAAALQVVQFSPVDCPRGIGRTLREHGFSLNLDPALHVWHP